MIKIDGFFKLNRQKLLYNISFFSIIIITLEPSFKENTILSRLKLLIKLELNSLKKFDV